ncbi:hypothetical protein [Paenibacillus hamazuiensis]|uniref:hypothetical protein n=1 Tax=Paenibacillus hamazuiensis TaxID=2936508 RepID=UPI00200FE58E|nr:hypothetical protein [Paenibacillus hamazuiensis]
MNYIPLDEFHVVIAKKQPDGQWKGEVVMLPADRRQDPLDATHLFDVPAQKSPEQLQELAFQALKAYREG